MYDNYSKHDKKIKLFFELANIQLLKEDRVKKNCMMYNKILDFFPNAKNYHIKNLINYINNLEFEHFENSIYSMYFSKLWKSNKRGE